MERCIVPGCPYMGYADTKKCWPHSEGLELPPDAGKHVTYDDGSPTKTYAAQKALDDLDGAE